MTTTPAELGMAVDAVADRVGSARLTLAERGALRRPRSASAATTALPADLRDHRGLPVANADDNGKPFTLAEAPVKKIAPLPLGTMRRAAC